MINFISEHWELLVSVITGGGLSSIITMRIGVKSAKTDLIAKVQDVYGKMVDDLRSEINTIRELGCLDKHCKERKKL
jgi:hypothetical protein